jgi:hypothetical protein
MSPDLRLMGRLALAGRPTPAPVFDRPVRAAGVDRHRPARNMRAARAAMSATCGMGRTKPSLVDRPRHMNLRLMDETTVASDTRPVPSPGAPVT